MKIQFNTKLKKLDKQKISKRFKEISKENERMQKRNGIPSDTLNIRVTAKQTLTLALRGFFCNICQGFLELLYFYLRYTHISSIFMFIKQQLNYG
jgi:hypothetical protein